MPEPSQPLMIRKILVAHPWIGRGGSEAAALWALQALQDESEVTLATASPIDWEDLNRIYGTAVNPDRVTVRRTPGFPGVRRADQWVQWQRAWFERQCRRIARDYDVCLSAYNPIDFGVPAIHLIADFSFSEKMRRLLSADPEDRPAHRSGLLRRTYLRIARLLTDAPGIPLAERDGLYLANSHWTAGHLKAHFGVASAPVVYPPVPVLRADRSPQSIGRDPYGFVAMSRIVPDKEIERIIDILDRVREAGFPVNLSILGAFNGTAYCQRILSLVEPRRAWISTPGFLDPTRKAAYFSKASFAIHGCRCEAFGIAVAEMAATGCAPFVPAGGGSAEVIANREELVYEDENQAARKIVALLKNPRRAAELRETAIRQAERYAPAHFMAELSRQVAAFRRPAMEPQTAESAISC